MFIICGSLFVAGCGPSLSSRKHIAEFEKAGPPDFTLIDDVSDGAENHTGSYRVVPGDLLELQMPGALRFVSFDSSESLQKVEIHSCRVSDSGTITLPIVGEIVVAEKNIAEIESAVIHAYFPKYVVNRPTVVCKVAEYRNENDRVFAVMGLVNRPNSFPYPSDVRYNLMEALAFAGGLNLVADPRYVRIYRQNADGNIVSATFAVRNKAVAEAYDIAIKPGDVVYVEHTLSTRVNAFLANVFSLSFGANARYYGQ